MTAPKPLSAEERREWADRALTDRYPSAGTMNRWWCAFQAAEQRAEQAEAERDALRVLAAGHIHALYMAFNEGSDAVWQEARRFHLAVEALARGEEPTDA